MKTIQFILSLMVVGLLASCSAENDVLTEMEEHNQLPNDEYVTVSLDLSADLNTRATGTGVTPDKGTEDLIKSYIIKVFGDQGVLLATLTENNITKTLNIKKQELKIYAIANFSNETFEKATTIEACTDFLANPKFGKTSASELPKAGYATVAAEECGTDTHMVKLDQLTARINKPIVEDSNYKIISMTIGTQELYLEKEGGVEEDFPYYVYPNTYSITLLTTSNITGKKYTFTYNGYEFSANTIYNPVLKGNNPSAAGLWIDWYVAGMKNEDINASVGEKDEN